MEYFTLTSINNSSAILFGGLAVDLRSNDVYILNFTDTSVVSVVLVWYNVWVHKRHCSLCISHIHVQHDLWIMFL